MSLDRELDRPGGGDTGTAARNDPALLIDGISKSFSSKTVLFPFKLSIPAGEIHALLGQNGSGKSTLIKILSGFHQPEAGGDCFVYGATLPFGSGEASHRLGLRFVHQDLGLIETSSILDNLSYGRFPTNFGTIRFAKARRRCTAALTAVGLDLDPRTLISALTPAQRTGVAVARAIFASDEPAAVLVLDEPTATLPTEEVQHLHTMLRTAAARGVAILYVTHHLDEVYQLSHRVSVLRDGHLVVTADTTQIDHDTLVHHLIGGALERVMRENARSHYETGSDVGLFEVLDLVAAPIAGVSFQARRGEVVGIYGLTGSGRESILGTIFGARKRESGQVTIGGTTIPDAPHLAVEAGVGYLPPDRKTSGGFMHLDATENLTITDLKPFWRRGWLSGRAKAAEARVWFDRLQIRPADGMRLPLTSFSGGNQQKVVLGKWLRVKPRVLLLDEPTQGVDVGAKAELHRQIMQASQEGAVVIISSTDVEELVSLCDRVLIMRQGRVATELSGAEVNESNVNSSSHAADATIERAES